MPPLFVFIVVVLPLFGATSWLVAVVLQCRRMSTPRDGRSETAAWWLLMAPTVAGLSSVAFMAGWLLQEPHPADELMPQWLVIPAGIVCVVGLRAVLRALRSALSADSFYSPIATVGLFRARVVVSSAFEDCASPEVMNAALAHEAAHVRGLDPLRIWFAQMIADLQWPGPGARSRLRRWALALELKRDDEAILSGASATALAESLIVAAQLTANLREAGRFDGPSIAVGAIGPGEGLAVRVRRLLDAPAGRAPRRSVVVPSLVCSGTLVASVAFGIEYGDAFLLLIPGAGR